MVNFRRAFFINFASSSGSTAVQFVVSMLLARLLTPSEVGVYSITIVFVNITHVFRDFGVSAYLQSEKDLTPQKIRSSIGVLCSSTWVIALILFICSWPVSRYYGYPEIRPVMQVLSLGFVFIPFSSIMLALNLREFRATQIAYVSFVGTLAYAGTCLGLAYFGFGTMSLAWANVANIVATGFAYIPLRPKNVPWLPSFKNWSGIIRFGLGSILTNVLNAINNALPDMLLGKLGSPHQVGLVSRANSTVNIFTYIAGSAINFGSLSYLAQVHHKRESLGPVINRSTALLTGIGWPALAMTGMLGREVVYTLYGSAWLECVPAIPALAMMSAVSMAFNYSGAAMTAIGRPYLAALPVAVTALSRAGLAIALFDGGIESFSWVLFGATALAAPVVLYLHAKILEHSPTSLLLAVWRSMVVTVACVFFCAAMQEAVPPEIGPSVSLLLFVPVITTVWYGSLRMTQHPLLEEVHRLVDKVNATAQRIFS